MSGVSEKERKLCQARWGRLVKEKPAKKQAGLAASFLVLARQKCKFGGRIGFVLPLTAAFAPSWEETRRMVEENFEDVIVLAVASAKGVGDHGLSSDTNMKEMLLIGTLRKSIGNHERFVRCVTLYNPILRAGEATVVAEAISKSIEKATVKSRGYTINVGESEIGKVYNFPFRSTGSGTWHPLGVLHTDLVFTADQLLDGKLMFSGNECLLGVDMCNVSDLFVTGTDHNQIGRVPSSKQKSGGFVMVPVRNEGDAVGEDRSLWKANAATQNKLVISLTHKGEIVLGYGTDEDRKELRQLQSTLFYAKNMRWTSQSLLVATTNHHGMGGRAWVSLLHEDSLVRKCFALWGNSIFGSLIHWTQGQRTQVGRSTTQKGAIESMPCPNFHQLPESKLREGESRFDEISRLTEDRKLRPVCQSHADDVRKRIDEAVLDMFGMKNEKMIGLVEKIRRLWCEEPSVHGNNRTALRILRQSSKHSISG